MRHDKRNPSPNSDPFPAQDVWETEPDTDDIPMATPAPPISEEEVPTATPAAVFCRRCGETSEPVENCCPWCGAWLVGKRPRVTPVYELEDEPEDDWHTHWREEDDIRAIENRPLIPPLVVVFVSYGLLLASLVLFIVLAVISGVKTEEEMHGGLALVEILDGALTLFALGLVWTTARQKIPRGAMGFTWLAAFPILAVLLCMNIAFMTFLRELLRPFGAQDAPRIELTWITVLLICVQPAIVEELFFRQMTLGVFRKSMNLHLAIWLTAAMFAFAHLGQILAMPYLFLVGGALGYARAWGGLSLAMLLHFIHNFVVIAYEAWR